MRREVLDDELTRREVELALVVATLDQLVERDVRLVDPRVLGRGERDVAGEDDHGIEEDELRNELRRAGRELECEASAEGVPDQDRLASADRLDDRVEVRADVPRRLPRRVAVPEQVERDDVVVGELAPRAARSGARGCGRRAGRRRAELPASPHSWSGEPHSDAASASSESGTISVRRSSRSFTSDQITTCRRGR